MSASPQARTSMTGSRSGLRAIPRGVWALGFVSLFMDTSSELIHSLLPVFLVSVLGASMTSVGLIEGVAEAMALLATDIRAVFWIAVIPALVSVAILVAFVNEPDRRADAGPRRVPLRLAEIKTLSAAYWGVVTVGAVLTLARFSEAFLVLRASGSGLAIALVPLVLVVMNVAYAASAYPA